MYREVMRLAATADIVVKAAAVADYRPVQRHEHKLKKRESMLTLVLERTPDILHALGQLPKRPFLIGFAAETEQLEKHAMDKLHRKNCDLIVANDVTQEGAGFGTDTNAETYMIATDSSNRFRLRRRKRSPNVCLLLQPPA